MPHIDITNATVVLNGVTIEGWSEDTDALMLPTIEYATVKRGADGKLQASSTGNFGGPIEFKLLATSPSTKWFEQKISSQLRGGAPATFEGSIHDRINNTTLRLSRGVLTNAPPGPSLGMGDAASMTFTVDFETIMPNYDSAEFTSAPNPGAGA